MTDRRRQAQRSDRTWSTDERLLNVRLAQQSLEYAKKWRASQFLAAARAGYTIREIATAAGLSPSNTYRQIVAAEEREAA